LQVAATAEISESLGKLNGINKDEKMINIIDTEAQGVSDGLKLALNVGTMLLSFIVLDVRRLTIKSLV
jgi:nucleoside permease NupC